ncbi:MAG: type II toxin-antitoxin system death-on-curing family toxin [Agathobacter sp.]|nr:type II toxin-antitoxin system death-on-curing family toxin [Agathobacter sp.]
MKKLSKEQILMLHTQLIQQTGGCDGVRDFNLLDSALETPFQSFGGDELYPAIQAKAARSGYGLIKNHCMIDGNKRLGAHAMLVFLAINGIELLYTQKELYETILSIADGKLDYEGLLSWVIEHQN